MQIIFRPNHDRPPKKFKPPLEKVPTPAVKESKEELDMEETPKAKVGFIVEEESEQTQQQLVEENQSEEDVENLESAENEVEPEEKSSVLSHFQQGGDKSTPGCKPANNCSGHPNPAPEDPPCTQDHVCKPYPYPGNYYPLQCLGYAYIPWQIYQRQFQPNEALEKGTLFPELYSPYFPERRPPVIPRPYCNMWQCPNMMRRRKR